MKFNTGHGTEVIAEKESRLRAGNFIGTEPSSKGISEGMIHISIVTLE